jgi:hypothetical protein
VRAEEGREPIPQKTLAPQRRAKDNTPNTRMSTRIPTARDDADDAEHLRIDMPVITDSQPPAWTILLRFPGSAEIAQVDQQHRQFRDSRTEAVPIRRRKRDALGIG